MCIVLDPVNALSAWSNTGPIAQTPDAGLINETWLVGTPPHAVLQWLNPIFSPAVNADIDAVTKRLKAMGLTTPELIPTASGELWHSDESGCWRLMTFIPGRTLHSIPSAAVAFEAGRVVGRFHAALDGWSSPQHAPRRDVHDTPSRILELHRALETGSQHPLMDRVRPVSDAILEQWGQWSGPLDLPERTCHGDLKISNLRFHARDASAICLLDLDTVGPMDITCELGDAWRSWCNPAGEDSPEDAHFDVGLFEASAAGFRKTAPALTSEEHEGLIAGIERICIELASRFCADALNNSYFREDSERYPVAGEHNLHRAHCQLALAQSVRAQRLACEKVLATSP